MCMYKLIKNFPQQLKEAIALGQGAQLTPAEKPIYHVVVAGMGGSGMSGTLVKQWVVDQLRVPLEVSHDYTLPAYVNEHTLLIAASYSGNTEETLAALQEGLRRQAKVVCITAGGAMQGIAQKYSIDHILFPADMPPRVCTVCAAVQQLFVLHFHQLIVRDFVAALQATIQLVDQLQPALQAEAQQVAAQLKGKLPVIYTTASYEAVAIRLRQQLNENSKQLCWHHVVPEMNHNELVGWHQMQENLAVLMLYGGTTHPRTALQQQLAQVIIQKQAATFLPLSAQGETPLMRSLYLIYLCDWVTYYLAQGKSVDPMEVTVIGHFKAMLKNKD